MVYETYFYFRLQNYNNNMKLQKKNAFFVTNCHIDFAKIGESS